jgi:hypothetical protein
MLGNTCEFGSVPSDSYESGWEAHEYHRHTLHSPPSCTAFFLLVFTEATREKKQGITSQDWLTWELGMSCSPSSLKPIQERVSSNCACSKQMASLSLSYALFLFSWSLGENQSEDRYATGWGLWGGSTVFVCFLASFGRVTRDRANS